MAATDAVGQDLPRQVTTPAAGGWANVSAGDNLTCATHTNGTLWCWGYDHFGELGIGSHTDQDLPRQVTFPRPGGWASIAAGGLYTCATRTDATLWCWGSNDDGELGIGNSPDQHLPQQVRTPAPGGWASITAGSGQTCAIRTGATLWCWGFNGYGKLGTGNYTSPWRPQQVTGCRQMTLSPPAPTSALRPLGQAASPDQHRAHPCGHDGKNKRGPCAIMAQ